MYIGGCSHFCMDNRNISDLSALLALLCDSMTELMKDYGEIYQAQRG